MGKDGQTALIKFQIRSVKDEKKVFERGEVSCRLGHSEVLDGWVDGNVDIEEVLGAWSRSLAGMRVGGGRRIWIPSRRGFRDGGGDAVSATTELLFDVDLKKIK